MPRTSLCIAFALLFTSSLVAADGWPMRSHDVRRTGRTEVNGPRSATKVWKYTAEDGALINIEPTVTSDGVFFGTWGVIRRKTLDKRQWDKFDGKIFGLNPRTGKELWPPLHPGHTPYAYKYDKRPPTQQDKPAGKGVHWNWYNGTIEGTGCIDPVDGTMYVGRGDGTLYAVDPRRGRVKWKYLTIDPARPDDPEGGGEIVGGPLITRGGVIIFGTFAAPHRPDPPKKIRHETNAVYGVSRAGKMLWRYPTRGTLEQVFSAPVALSPDGRTVYAATNLPDGKKPCELLALNATTGKLSFRLEMGNRGTQDMAVGPDGRVFLVGLEQGVGFPKPFALAVNPRGRGSVAWGPAYVEGTFSKSHWAGGIALMETSGKLRDVYVSTTTHRNINARGGQLHRVDPTSGKVTASWNPEAAKPSCVGGLSDLTLDDEGVVYVGVRGQKKTLGKAETRGRMYALRHRGKSFEVIWSYEVDGQIDWASPAIGPNGGLYFGSSDRTGHGLSLFPPAARQDVRDADPVFYGILP